MNGPTIKFFDGTAVPQCAFGTYRLTGVTCTESVREAIDLGYRHIDTAQVYDNQQDIAKAIKDYPRDELFITSKLWIGDHTKRRVGPACARILRELKTDYVDLLLIHWPDRTVPFAETLEAMYKLVDEHKVRAVGVSNFNHHHLADVFEHGLPVATNQIEVQPYFQQPELYEFCAEHDIVVSAHSILGRGLVPKGRILKSIGQKHGKSAVQVALRWALQLGFIIISNSRHYERIEENSQILDFELSNSEMDTIGAINTGKRIINPAFADFDY